MAHADFATFKSKRKQSCHCLSQVWKRKGWYCVFLVVVLVAVMALVTIKVMSQKSGETLEVVSSESSIYDNEMYVCFACVVFVVVVSIFGLCFSD